MHTLLALIIRAMRKVADALEPAPDYSELTESYLMFGDWLR